MSKRTIAVIEEARASSVRFLATIPASRKAYRTHSENVIAVCQDLVSAQPTSEPRSPRVSELGRSRYANFPASQTLLNQYAPLLTIWRAAFQAMVSASVALPKSQDGTFMLNKAGLAGLDSGTRGQIDIAMAILRETTLENDRLKKHIKDTIPAPSLVQARPLELSATSSKAVTAIRGWLNRIDQKRLGLHIDEQGVRVDRGISVRHIVMEPNVLQALKEICSVTEEGGSSEPPVAISGLAGLK